MGTIKNLGFIIMFILCFSKTYAQLGVRLGLGISQSRYEGTVPLREDVSRYALLEAGVFYKQKYKSFFVEPCISYVNRNYNSSLTSSSNIELFVPIGYQLKTKFPLRFFAGVSANYVPSSKIYKDWSLTTPSGQFLSQGIERIDMLYGFKIGAGISLKRITVDLVYEQFLTSHWKVERTYDQYGSFDYYNRALALKVGYCFWE